MRTGVLQNSIPITSISKRGCSYCRVVRQPVSIKIMRRFLRMYTRKHTKRASARHPVLSGELQRPPVALHLKHQHHPDGLQSGLEA
jgi:hypothetical protein